jgi:uncharacterized SAM-binding protein YcdF (DUF218 family)
MAVQSRSRTRIVAAVALSLLALASAAWLATVPLLRGAANAWIVSDPPTQADAVVVLGGGLDVRPFAAARYYREARAKTILVAQVRSGPSQAIGAVPTHSELNRQVLLKLGISPDAIDGFGADLSNTRQEAVALRAWADRAEARSLIVPTEIFSSRRVRWMLDQAFAGSGVRIEVPALDTSEYTRDDWWRHEQGLIAFQNEIIKYAYYRLKYRRAL